MLIVHAAALQRCSNIRAPTKGESFTALPPESSYQSFVASSGWLTNFILQHGFRDILLQRESLSVDMSQIDSFKGEELFQRIMTGGWLFPGSS